MSYKHQKKPVEKYRVPKNPKETLPNLLLRGSNAAIHLIYFVYHDTGFVDVVNSPDNLVWTFDSNTGELTVEDKFDSNVVYEFIYGDDIGHVLRETHEIS